MRKLLSGVMVLMATLWMAVSIAAADDVWQHRNPEDVARNQQALKRYLREVELYVPAPDSREVMGLAEAADRWLDALAKRDVGGVLPFVTPEERAYVRGHLSDPTDVLYGTLFSERGTYRLADPATRGVMFLRTGTWLNPGPGIDVCVFDRRRHDPHTDEERIALFRQSPPQMDCHFFYYDDGHWRFGFSALTEGPPESYDPPTASSPDAN